MAGVPHETPAQDPKQSYSTAPPPSTRKLEVAALENIPEELSRRPQWLVWRLEERGGKPTKVPYIAGGVGRASATDLTTWCTFEEAVHALQAGRYGGIGFVFSSGDPYSGVDLDDCRNPDTGEVEMWAREIVEELASYTEVSPSGTGVHIIVRAELPPGGRSRTGNVEMYDRGRFFTVTGQRLEGTLAEIHERQAALRRVHRRVFGESKAAGERGEHAPPAVSAGLTDQEIIARAMRAENGDKFIRLWKGDASGYGSQSEADLALCSLLAFWVGPDESRIDDLFRKSGLYRKKWERADYRERTIRSALDRRDFYTPDDPGGPPSPGSTPPEGGANGRGAGGDSGRFHLTDLGNAERFVASCGEDVRYCYSWSKWLAWAEKRWERDDAGQVHRLAKETPREIYQEAGALEENSELRKELSRHAIRSEAEARIKAILELAKSEVPVSPHELDADPWLLNVENGTLDLRNGKLRKHDRKDMISKLAPVPYDPDAKAPTWEAFLERVLPGPELREFVQRAVGYSLTGDTSERVLLILHGVGRNGKSTFLEAIREALGAEGGYAMKTPAETLMAKPAGGIPNDVARLKGARFVSASETEAGRRLAEALVKEITGNDTISARFMRGEWFDFRPTHKVWLATNHKPEIRGTDHAMWDRIRLVPFDVRIPDGEVDRELPEKLRAELPGILAWAVEGCLKWQKHGLGTPGEVLQATKDYRAEMDVLAAFIEECCVVQEKASVGATPLYEAYKAWCGRVGETAETQTKFGSRIRERGFNDGKDTKTRRKLWLGIGLFTDREPDAASDEQAGGTIAGDGAKQLPDAKQTETDFRHNALRENFFSAHAENGFRTASEDETVSPPPCGDRGEATSGRSAPPGLDAYLADPPSWLVGQVEQVRRTPSLLNPTCATIAYDLYGYAGRWAEVAPIVSAWIAGEWP